MRKAGAKSYEEYSKQILKICSKKPLTGIVSSSNSIIASYLFKISDTAVTIDLFSPKLIILLIID